MSEATLTEKTSQLQKLSIAETQLAEFKNFKTLTIADVNDRQGYKAVDEARKEVKKERVRIDKERKAINEDAQQFIKTVNAKAKEYTEVLTEVEEDLESKLFTIDNEKERIRLEAERAEQERLQKRVALLISYGCSFDGIHYSIGELSMSTVEIKNALDEQFDNFSAAVIAEHDAQVAIKVEEERKQKEEAERLVAERLELEKLRKEQEEREATARAEQERKEREFKAEQDRIRKEQEEKEAAIVAAQQKIEAEKQAMELTKQREEAEKVRAEQEAARIEEQKRLAVESERREQERLKAEEAENLRLAKLEEERQLSLRPDKEKLLAFSRSLDLIEVPTCEVEVAQKITADIKEMISKMQKHILSKVKAL